MPDYLFDFVCCSDVAHAILLTSECQCLSQCHSGVCNAHSHNPIYNIPNFNTPLLGVCGVVEYTDHIAGIYIDEMIGEISLRNEFRDFCYLRFNLWRYSEGRFMDMDFSHIEVIKYDSIAVTIKPFVTSSISHHGDDIWVPVLVLFCIGMSKIFYPRVHDIFTFFEINPLL